MSCSSCDATADALSNCVCLCILECAPFGGMGGTFFCKCMTVWDSNNIIGVPLGAIVVPQLICDTQFDLSIEESVIAKYCLASLTSSSSRMLISI